MGIWLAMGEGLCYHEESTSRWWMILRSHGTEKESVIVVLFATDFRRNARQALSGHWPLAMAVGFVAFLMSGGQEGQNVVVRFQTNSSAWMEGMGQSELMVFLTPILANLVTVLSIWVIASLILCGPTEVGNATFNLNLLDRKEARFSQLFSNFTEFPKFFRGFVMALLRTLYIFLWSILFIIPGIVASYSYAMAPYILAERPELGGAEALAASKVLMRGNRWRLFCLQFSFVGWLFLSWFTLGIGSLWVIPYMNMAQASFYREILREQAQERGEPWNQGHL